MANWAKALDVMGDTVGNIGQYISNENAAKRAKMLQLTTQANNRAYARGLITNNRLYQQGLLSANRKYKEKKASESDTNKKIALKAKNDFEIKKLNMDNEAKSRAAMIKADAIVSSDTVKQPTISNKISVQKAIEDILKNKNNGADKLSPYELEQINSYRSIIGEPPLKQIVAETNMFGSDTYALAPDTGGDLVSKLRAALESSGVPGNPQQNDGVGSPLPSAPSTGLPDNIWSGSSGHIR